MPTLNIVRGLPDSGKSSYAKQAAELDGGIVVEADQYFTSEEGIYTFRSDLLFKAHEDCYSRTIDELFRGHNVYVANTFTTKKELKRYFNIKEMYPHIDINLVVTEIYTRFNTTNGHAVPLTTVKAMAARWYVISLEVVKQYGLVINTIS